LPDWIPYICLGIAVLLLGVLSVIDLKTRLLPNEYVLCFAMLAVIFHFITKNHFLSWQDAALGGLMGFASLYLLRAVANRMCGFDTLGLGDVKLIGAAGLWLGPENVMLAMGAGACVSLLHGFVAAMIEARKTGQGLNLAQMHLPAGPGFACGIIIAGLYMFGDIL
jgi:leader peptidase (prepilin peptidase)/N-methyltransferase